MHERSEGAWGKEQMEARVEEGGDDIEILSARHDGTALAWATSGMALWERRIQNPLIDMVLASASVEDQINYNDHPAHKFWSIYVDEATKHDANLTETWKADMDSTLIFAGLFSATVTTFIIESYKLLKPDPIDITATLLSPSAVTVNILWFLSLAFSLTTALIVTLVQQWIRDYLQRIQRHSQPQRRGRARRFLFNGLEKWKLETVVEYIPTLLHLSVFLFFAGLCIFLSLVDTVVAWLVLCVFVCCLAAYAFATIVPIMDPSAPYETPLSSPMQHLQRFIKANSSTTPHSDSLVQLKVCREQAATSSTLDGDRHALMWAFERITDDRELELFVESIPGFLASSNGQDVWWATFDPSFDLTVEISIAQFLRTILNSEHIDQDSKRKRAGVCLDALFSILCSEGHLRRKSRWASDIDEKAYDKFHRLFSSTVKDISGFDWDSDNSLALKASGVLALSHRPPIVAEDFSAASAASRHEISHVADKAFEEMTHMRSKLEDAIQGLRVEDMESPASRAGVDQVKASLHDYIAALNTSSHLVGNWMATMSQNIQNNKWLSLVEWYSHLPIPNPSQTTILLPVNLLDVLPNEPQLDIYGAWVLAAMRRTYLYPALPHFSKDQSKDLDDSNMLEGQSRPLKRSTLQDHLLRELQPMLMVFHLLPEIRGRFPSLSRDIAARTIQLVGDKDEHYLDWPGPKHHKPGFFLPMGRHLPDRIPPETLSAVMHQPFSMFTSIIFDGLEGSRTLSLLAFFSNIKHSKATFKLQQTSVVKKLLQLLYPVENGVKDFDTDLALGATTTTSCVVKEGTIFFYSVFSDILAWERDICSQDKVCPLSSELQRLVKDVVYVTLVRGRVAEMGAAEAMLRGAGSRIPERHLRDMWDVRLFAAAICKRIRIQRSSVVRRKSTSVTLHTEGSGSVNLYQYPI
ncbi:hypothetical protein DXG01_001087 [Tephrocybe rancida]|nr:hypothetical protein DXG01_001087 [Tephrocybe rancida]